MRTAKEHQAQSALTILTMFLVGETREGKKEGRKIDREDYTCTLVRKVETYDRGGENALTRP
jgi:hypothetical protein